MVELKARPDLERRAELRSTLRLSRYEGSSSNVLRDILSASSSMVQDINNCRCGKACCHILVSTSSKEVEDYRVELRVLLTRAKNTKDPMRPRASLIALCSRFLCLFLLNP